MSASLSQRKQCTAISGIPLPTMPMSAVGLSPSLEREAVVAAPGRVERINGIDVSGLRQYIDAVEKDTAQADRHPVVVGKWVGGTRAEVTSTLGGPPVYM